MTMNNWSSQISYFPFIFWFPKRKFTHTMD